MKSAPLAKSKSQGREKAGAGEGNRTLVFSLEGGTFPNENNVLSCKTSTIDAQDNQGVTAETQNSEFELQEHSVYHGRRRLGRYERVAKQRYAAFDAVDQPLGEFKRRKDAWAAIGRADRGVAQ